MEPVFLDFHIHTSHDFGKTRDGYDVDALKRGIEKIADGSPYLISLTDHNFINKKAYLEAVNKIDNILLGAELHIKNYKKAPPYHCHILFEGEITEEFIDDVNDILDVLYPEKMVSKNDTNIPKLEDIANSFDKYEFLLLPHAGQSHSSFNKSIPSGITLDKTLERNLYYNHFDGFTARAKTKLQKNNDYFDKLGISDFINLVTVTDNYEPEKYPACKAERKAEESDFIPTWMLAEPTFDGLRLALSESDRLKYDEKPDSWSDHIRNVELHEEKINIDAKLTAGLNVVIGSSASGKTLFVDSIYRKIKDDFSKSDYKKAGYNIENIEVVNPTGQHPYYINQNSIIEMSKQKSTEANIGRIPILKDIFPYDGQERDKINSNLLSLEKNLSKLVQAVEKIDDISRKLEKIPHISHLITTEDIRHNPLNPVLPSKKIIATIDYQRYKFEEQVVVLDEIEKFLSENPLFNHKKGLVPQLKKELENALRASGYESEIRDIITEKKNEIERGHKKADKETSTKKIAFSNLLTFIGEYIEYELQFSNALEEIAQFDMKIKTKTVNSMGHKLSVKNEFELSEEKFLEVINEALLAEFQIDCFANIMPENLTEEKYKNRPKIDGYDGFIKYVSNKFNELNERKFHILTNKGQDFNSLSPGWKTSVILDLILGSNEDHAPLIIDQPEDNLAATYINSGLVKAIKECKVNKQIILVSHNATIPILGDAQNIILCTNDNGHIKIKSSGLEGKIDNEKVLDLVAHITDGGKTSIKKRFKKYNIKSFRGDKNEN